MTDTIELKRRLDDAESRLAYLCGYARSTIWSLDNISITNARARDLAERVIAEAIAVMPYLEEGEA